MPAISGYGRGLVAAPERLHRVSAILPATTQAPIFTVRGGAVEVFALVGRFTAAADGTATTLKITGNPTVGSDVDLCTAVAITSFAIGRLVGLSGAALAVAQAFARPAAPFIIAAGTIDLVTSATNLTGSVEWWIEYAPIDQRARIIAA